MSTCGTTTRPRRTCSTGRTRDDQSDAEPLVRRGEDTAATEGLGLFHDATEAVKGFADGHWAEGLMNAGGAVAGVLEFMVDPIAGLLSAGFGWLIEHVSFLSEPLDWLTGNQQTLDGMAKTWSSVSSHLTETSTQLSDAVKGDTAAWSGEDTARYRAFGEDRAHTYAAVAESARGMSVLIMMCKTILKVVRDIVRDLISEAIGKLVGICLRWAPAVAAFGAGVAGAIAECVPTAIGYADKALEWCRKLTRAFGKASGLFTWLDGHLAKARQALATKGDTIASTFRAVEAADDKRVADLLGRPDMSIPFRMVGKDAFGEAKQVVVDGVTGLPKTAAHNGAVEVGKENAKQWDQFTETGSQWKSWRELKQVEDEEDAKKKQEALEDEAADRRGEQERRYR